MEIVFVLENYYPHLGGVEVLFQQLTEELAKDKDNDIIVITHRLSRTKSYEIINNVHVHRVNVPPFLSRYFFTFLSLPKILKHAKDADIIHTTTYNGAPPARLASMILKKPTVITINEVIGDKWLTNSSMSKLSAKLHRFLEKLIVRLRFTRFVCISYSTQKDLLKVNSKVDSSIIYPGVDTVFWNPAKYSGKEIREKYNLKGKFVYLFFGRPGVTKGLEYLIRAVPKISKEIPNSVLFAIISKDKAYQKRYDYIIRLVDELGLKDKVIIKDPVARKELPNYIKMADCIVVPSLTEGFGFTTIESCYMQKPIIASNTTSLPEVIFGNYILVKPKDPESIAQGVIDIFNNKGTISRKKDFSIKKSINGYMDVYKSILKRI